MITLKKLGELPRKTRLRKISRILLRLEHHLRGLPSPDGADRELPDRAYLGALFSAVAQEARLSPSLRRRAQGYVEQIAGSPHAGLSVELVRPISDIRYGLEEWLGHTPADWDFYRSGRLDADERRVENVFLYLDDVRSPFNVGAIFRAADSFGVREIYVSEGTASPEHPRAKRAAMGAIELIPWRRASLPEAIAVVARLLRAPPNVLAVETGGTHVAHFRFPSAGIAVVGSEELGVSAEALRLAAQSSGRISIPTAGAKGSLNVAVATGIVLYQWWHALTG
ncbi:MAG: TrmH family RNA methyltransferase [Spirochaetaceae bacterium]|nr:MAG: TrmH family RNA methyltransferase [Spirochaetaceae bacterium]